MHTFHGLQSSVLCKLTINFHGVDYIATEKQDFVFSL